jgi:hypothetical protein
VWHVYVLCVRHPWSDASTIRQRLSCGLSYVRSCVNVMDFIWATHAEKPPKLIINIVALHSYLDTVLPCFASHTSDCTLGYSTPHHMWIPAVNSENYDNFIRTKLRLQRKWAWLPTKFTHLILLLKYIQINAVFMAYCFVCRWYSNVHRCLKIVLK